MTNCISSSLADEFVDSKLNYFPKPSTNKSRDAGINTGVAIALVGAYIGQPTDITGMLRPQGDAYNIGAWEQ